MDFYSLYDHLTILSFDRVSNFATYTFNVLCANLSQTRQPGGCGRVSKPGEDAEAEAGGAAAQPRDGAESRDGSEAREDGPEARQPVAIRRGLSGGGEMRAQLQ